MQRRMRVSLLKTTIFAFHAITKPTFTFKENPPRVWSMTQWLPFQTLQDSLLYSEFFLWLLASNTAPFLHYLLTIAFLVKWWFMMSLVSHFQSKWDYRISMMMFKVMLNLDSPPPTIRMSWTPKIAGQFEYDLSAMLYLVGLSHVEREL